jgi:UDP-N-acetylglucosamine 2-epimerase (non-hydrolysing)
MPIKVSVVIGTRPELIKMSPLLRRLEENPGVDFQFIDTGQHYDYEMDSIFCDELNLPKPIFLNVGSDTPGKQTGRALIAVEAEILRYQPDLVMVVGDTNSTLSGALVAAKLNIPVAHIEAGLRSFDRTMPEEINRVIVDHISRWLFVPTQQASDNLVAEGIDREKVTFTYDIHVDVLNDNFKIADEKSQILNELGVENFVLITCHRPGNTDSHENLANITHALIELAQKTHVIFPVHPRTAKKLHEFELYELLEKEPHIKLIKPVGFFDFLKLMGHADCVITDSGGVQKETLILKTPCVTIRENTEWVETLHLNANVLVGTDREKIVTEVQQRSLPAFRKFMQQLPNPYGSGETSQIILDTILADFDRIA